MQSTEDLLRAKIEAEKKVWTDKGYMICNHVKWHKWKLRTQKQKLKYFILEDWGWFHNGYCYVYYPAHLEDQLQKEIKKQNA